MSEKTESYSLTKKSLITAGVIIGLILILYLVRPVIFPFFIGFIIAYLLDPVVDKLEKWHIPRALGIVFIIVVFLLLIFLLILFLYPKIYAQISFLINKTPEYLEALKAKLYPYFEQLHGKYPETIDKGINKIKTYIRNNIPSLLAPVTSFFQTTFSSTLNFLLGLLDILVIPVFAFYILKDLDPFLLKIRNLIPNRYRDWVVKRFREVDAVLGGFIRGQLIVATILAALYCIGLSLVGIPMAILIGLTAGYANIIPYFGVMIGLLPSVLLAYLEYGDIWHIIGAIAVFSVAQFLEGMFITPKVVGDKVGLNPLSVIISIIIGGELLGFLGILIAVPAAAALSVFIRAGYRTYVDSDFYKKEVKVKKD